MKMERLQRLILAIDGAVKGENLMKSFDNSQIEKYKAEVKEKWGATDAYQEHAHKTKDYSKQQWKNVLEG